jgi:hypothetical protein
MRILEMSFSTELGTNKVIRIYEAKEALTGAQVAACMDNIVAKNIFTGPGGNITGKVKAQVVTTTTTDVNLI